MVDGINANTTSFNRASAGFPTADLAASPRALTPVQQGEALRAGGNAGQTGAAAGAAAGTPKHTGTAADFAIKGGKAQDTRDLNQALTYLSKSPTAKALLDKLPVGTKLQIIHDGNDRYSPSTKTVYWDPRSGLTVTSGQGTQSAALGLIHEIDHAVNGQKNPQPTGDGYQNTEEKRVIAGSETTIAHDLGEPTRTDHYGTTKVMASSTDHTDVSAHKAAPRGAPHLTAE